MKISRTADDALRMLELIRAQGPMELDDLATLTGASLSTCERRLDTLALRGYVVRRSDSTWGLGSKLLYLAGFVPDHLALAASDPVEEVADSLGVNVVVSTPDPPNYKIVVERDGRGGAVRVEHFAGVTFEMWRSASGLALMDAIDERAREDVIRRAPDRGAIEEALQQLRSTGVVVATSRLFSSRVGVSAPIVLTNGAIAGSITISIQKDFWIDPDLASSHVLRTAARIAARYERMSGRSTIRPSTLQAVGEGA